MLSRGFYDTVVLWPVVFWPIVFSSCFYAYIKLCADLRNQLIPATGGIGQRAGQALGLTALAGAIAIEFMAHGYMLMVAGYFYLVVAIPIYVFGWILLPALLDGMRSGLGLLAATHLIFVSAFFVLLGFADIGVLRALNRDLYQLLTGLPAAL